MNGAGRDAAARTRTAWFRRRLNRRFFLVFLDGLGDLYLLGLRRLRLSCGFGCFFLNYRGIRSFCDFGLLGFGDRFRPRLNNRLNNRFWRRCLDRDGFHHRRLFDRDFDLGDRMFRFRLFLLNRFRGRLFHRLWLAGDHRHFRFGNDHFDGGVLRFFRRCGGFRKFCFQSRFHGIGAGCSTGFSSTSFLPKENIFLMKPIAMNSDALKLQAACGSA